MPSPGQEDVDRAAKMICSYLRVHPHAADTAEGIQRWWIAPLFGEVALSSVERALEQLEGVGIVKKLDAMLPRPAYARGPRFDERT